MQHPVCDKCRLQLDEAAYKNSVWYGYVHVNGCKHLKRIASTDDWEEAWQSDFVAKISRPFLAQGRKKAQEIFEELLKQHGKMEYMAEWLEKQMAKKTLMAKSGSDFTCVHNEDLNVI